MEVAMKPEVTDPVVYRVFRQPLLRQEPCPLLTWEHEHELIKPSAVRQYWRKLIFQTDLCTQVLLQMYFAYLR